MYASEEHLSICYELHQSFLMFVKFFFKELTQNDFIIHKPLARRSHVEIIIEALERCENLSILNLVINLPPGHGKSTLVCFWIAWILAKYPDTEHLYISNSKHLARKHTSLIKDILELKSYQLIFDVHIERSASAKSFFKTTKGGVVAAFGSKQGVVGHNAGKLGLNRISGSCILDDMHNTDEVHSILSRESVFNSYKSTARQRRRDYATVPYINIGQRVHDEDICSFFLGNLKEKDIYKWDSIVLKAIDDAGNVLCPQIIQKETLELMKERDKYTFNAQYQQSPDAASSKMFTKESFVILKQTPKIIRTFITVDTAETEKQYNDATVFSFWGAYYIEDMGVNTGQIGLHWIDCFEERLEWLDMKTAFTEFLQKCYRFPVQPSTLYIEKKSTGVALFSELKNMRTLEVKPIERTCVSGSKVSRLNRVVPFVGAKRVSFTLGDSHIDKCIEHMTSIAHDGSHSHDDIADTLADAINIALVDNYFKSLLTDKKDDKAEALMQSQEKRIQALSHNSLAPSGAIAYNNPLHPASALLNSRFRR